MQTLYSTKTTSQRSLRASPTSAASDQTVTGVSTSQQPQDFKIRHQHRLSYQDGNIQTKMVHASVTSQLKLLLLRFFDFPN